jgi:hypothetical protein
VSYSFREPEWPAACECKYDEARDKMDREDCPFHCDPSDDSIEARARTTPQRRLARNADAKVNESAA